MHGVGGAQQQFLPQEIIFFAEVLFIYFFVWAISRSSTPPHLGLLHVGRRHSPFLLLCQEGRHGQQHNPQPGSGAPPGTDVTLRGQGLTTQPHPLATSCSQPHPQCHHSPECMWMLSPCLSCISQHYQPPHQLWQTAWYQCCPNSQMQPWLGRMAVGKAGEAEKMFEEALGLLPALSHSRCAS